MWTAPIALIHSPINPELRIYTLNYTTRVNVIANFFEPTLVAFYFASFEWIVECPKVAIEDKLYRIVKIIIWTTKKNQYQKILDQLRTEEENDPN